MTRAQAEQWIAAIERLPWGKGRYRARGQYCAVGSGIHTFCTDVEPTLDPWTYGSYDAWRRATEAFRIRLHLSKNAIDAIMGVNDRHGQTQVVALIRALSSRSQRTHQGRP